VVHTKDQGGCIECGAFGAMIVRAGMGMDDFFFACQRCQWYGICRGITVI